MLLAEKQNLMNALHDIIRSDVNLLKIAAVIGQGIDPCEIFDNPQRGCNGNVLHMHASVYHTNYGEADHSAVRYFIEMGVDVNASNDNSLSPLQVALAHAEKNEALYKCISFLIENGADVNARYPNGDTLLHHAMQVDDWRLYKLLVASGADPSIKDADGNDATRIWHLLAEDRISSTTVETPIRYRLTEIFNFSTKIYTSISQNMVTQAEAQSVLPFEALAGSELLEQAYVALNRKGGKAEFTAGTLRKTGLTR